MLLPPASAPGADLPVRAVLGDVVAALSSAGTAVLVAPPGTGKTSLLPLALADAVEGRVVVAEPRRIATRAAARRLAWLVGEEPGRRVGYAMRDDRVPGSRIEVVTTGVLVRRLMRDPELPGVGAVVIDECHERHLDADLALAFAVDVRATLRPDLGLVATSATPDTDRMVAALGEAPLVTATSVTHPVDVVWAPPASAPRRAGRDHAFADHVAAVTRRALAERPGDVLVFVPGEAEVDAVARRLSGAGTAVFPLFGRQPGAEQERALTPGPVRRVVVATAVAESSLTVPGVRIVVDAGLARGPSFDHVRGLGALVTTRVSRASAEQRAGRAGREAPGAVFRCWSEADHQRLEAHTPPEIATSDLAGFALTVAAWGSPGGVGLSLLDAPPAAALTASVDLLRELGAVDGSGRITPRGRAFAEVAAHPRLARALVDGAPLVGPTLASSVVAFLADTRLPAHGDDLPARLRAQPTGAAARGARVGPEARHLRRFVADVPHPAQDLPLDLAVGTVVGLAYPDRLARARSADGTTYLTSGGVGAALAEGSGLRGSAWLAIAEADRPVGRADARIRLAAPIDEATARLVAGGLLGTAEEVAWEGGRVVARGVERLGAIELVSRVLRDPAPELVARAVRTGLSSSGIGVLNWTGTARSLRARLALLHRVLGDPWPDVSDEALLARLDDWLVLTPAVTRTDVAQALRRLLPWPDASRLDQLVPERVPVPTGGTRALDYSADPPVLALKVQEAFGWRRGPTVVDGRVPVVLHLLSPAGRPTAVTSDLESFWTQGYPQVRADLRGRYPRHPWPDDPTTAAPTSRVKPRRS